MGYKFRKGLAAFLSHGISPEAAVRYWQGRRPSEGSTGPHVQDGLSTWPAATAGHCWQLREAVTRGLPSKTLSGEGDSFHGGQLLPAPQEEKVEVAWPFLIYPQKPPSNASATLYHSEQSPAHPDQEQGQGLLLLRRRCSRMLGSSFKSAPGT